MEIFLIMVHLTFAHPNTDINMIVSREFVGYVSAEQCMSKRMAAEDTMRERAEELSKDPRANGWTLQAVNSDCRKVYVY